MENKKIIFDTDIGGDSDDVTALDLFLSAHRQGLCTLLGVSCTSLIPEGFSCARAVLSSHHMEQIPLCAMPAKREIPHWYGPAVTYAFPHLSRFEEKAPLPLPVLRRLIAENPGVILVVTGECTNFAELLKSPPDEISPLSGVELVRQNVAFVSLMAGNFIHQNGILAEDPEYLADGSIKPCEEYNVICNLAAADTVFSLCPVDLFVVPYEAGYQVISGKILYEKGTDIPDGFAFHTEERFRGGRDSWDPMAAYFALYGASPYFSVSEGGKVTVDEKGITYFTPCREGRHFILQLAVSKEEMGKAIDREIAPLFEIEEKEKDAVQRVEEMEKRFDASFSALENLKKALEAYQNTLPDLKILDEYLQSPFWMQDYDADNAGKFPSGMKRGVLSQDALYDLLMKNKELMEKMKELAGGKKYEM